MFALALPLLLLAPALPAPASAPHALPLASQQIRFALADDAAFAVLLVALDDRRVPFLGRLVLEPALALSMAPIDGRLGATLTLPPSWDATLYWQAVAVAADGSFRFSQIDKLSPPVDGTLIEVHVAPDDAAIARSPEPSPSPPELSLAPITRDDGLLIGLHAAFVAPTDGFALALVDVTDADGDDNAEVFLYRKLPGKGEGRRRVEQKLSLTARLPHGQPHIDVWLAEGTGTRPAPGATYRLIGRVPADH